MHLQNIDLYQITIVHFTFEKYDVLELEKVGVAAATKCLEKRYL